MAHRFNHLIKAVSVAMLSGGIIGSEPRAPELFFLGGSLNRVTLKLVAWIGGLNIPYFR